MTHGSVTERELGHMAPPGASAYLHRGTSRSGKSWGSKAQHSIVLLSASSCILRLVPSWSRVCTTSH